MLVFACIGLDTRVAAPLEELKNGKYKYHEGYIFFELNEPIKDTKWCLGYPLYSSKSNIPERFKKTCKIKAIRINDKDMYEIIKQREDRNKKIKAEIGLDLDYPFDSNIEKFWRIK